MENKTDKTLDKAKSKNDLAWEEVEKSFKDHEAIAEADKKEKEDHPFLQLLVALFLLPLALVAVPLLIFIVIFVILISGASSAK